MPRLKGDLRWRIRNLERRIARTERLQRTRKALVKRLREATGDDLQALLDFHLNQR